MRALFDWLRRAARRHRTRIGAFGNSLGGGLMLTRSLRACRSRRSRPRYVDDLPRSSPAAASRSPGRRRLPEQRVGAPRPVAGSPETTCPEPQPGPALRADREPLDAWAARAHRTPATSCRAGATSPSSSTRRRRHLRAARAGRNSSTGDFGHPPATIPAVDIPYVLTQVVSGSTVTCAGCRTRSISEAGRDRARAAGRPHHLVRVAAADGDSTRRRSFAVRQAARGRRSSCRAGRPAARARRRDVRHARRHGPRSANGAGRGSSSPS